MLSLVREEDGEIGRSVKRARMLCPQPALSYGVHGCAMPLVALLLSQGQLDLHQARVISPGAGPGCTRTLAEDELLSAIVRVIILDDKLTMIVYQTSS